MRAQELLKIGSYRHPKFGGIGELLYLCTVIQRYHPTLVSRDGKS